MNDKEFEWKVFFIALIRLFSFPAFIMLLWNWFMDKLFGLPHINYWEAFGLRLLVDLLFGNMYTMYFSEMLKKMK